MIAAYRRGGNIVEGMGPEAPNASTVGYDASAENNYGMGTEYRSPQTMQSEATAAAATKPNLWIYLLFGGAIAAMVLL